MFSSGNRKVRSSQPKTARELGRLPAMPELVKPRQLKRQALKVNEEIHRLECLIADAPRLQKQRRLATLDELPPMDSRPVRRPKKMSLAQKREVNSRRLGLCVEWVLVLGAITAAVGWLNQWFNFIPR